MIIRLLIESLGRLTVSAVCMMLIFGAYSSGKMADFLSYAEIPEAHTIYFLYASFGFLVLWTLMPPVNKLFE